MDDDAPRSVLKKSNLPPLGSTDQSRAREETATSEDAGSSREESSAGSPTEQKGDEGAADPQTVALRRLLGKPNLGAARKRALAFRQRMWDEDADRLVDQTMRARKAGRERRASVGSSTSGREAASSRDHSGRDGERGKTSEQSLAALLERRKERLHLRQRRESLDETADTVERQFSIQQPWEQLARMEETEASKQGFRHREAGVEDESAQGSRSKRAGAASEPSESEGDDEDEEEKDEHTGLGGSSMPSGMRGGAQMTAILAGEAESIPLPSEEDSRPHVVAFYSGQTSRNDFLRFGQWVRESIVVSLVRAMPLLLATVEHPRAKVRLVITDFSRSGSMTELLEARVSRRFVIPVLLSTPALAVLERDPSAVAVLRRALRLGADGMVERPLDHEALAVKMMTLIHRYDLTRDVATGVREDSSLAAAVRFRPTGDAPPDDDDEKRSKNLYSLGVGGGKEGRRQEPKRAKHPSEQDLPPKSAVPYPDRLSPRSIARSALQLAVRWDTMPDIREEDRRWRRLHDGQRRRKDGMPPTGQGEASTAATTPAVLRRVTTKRGAMHFPTAAAEREAAWEDAVRDLSPRLVVRALMSGAGDAKELWRVVERSRAEEEGRLAEFERRLKGRRRKQPRGLDRLASAEERSSEESDEDEENEEGSEDAEAESDAGRSRRRERRHGDDVLSAIPTDDPDVTSLDPQWYPSTRMRQLQRRRVLKVANVKGGQRKMPLSEEAVALLKSLGKYAKLCDPEVETTPELLEQRKQARDELLELARNERQVVLRRVEARVKTTEQENIRRAGGDGRMDHKGATTRGSRQVTDAGSSSPKKTAAAGRSGARDAPDPFDVDFMDDDDRMSVSTSRSRLSMWGNSTVMTSATVRSGGGGHPEVQSFSGGLRAVDPVIRRLPDPFVRRRLRELVLEEASVMRQTRRDLEEKERAEEAQRQSQEAAEGDLQAMQANGERTGLASFALQGMDNPRMDNAWEGWMNFDVLIQDTAKEPSIETAHSNSKARSHLRRGVGGRRIAGARMVGAVAARDDEYAEQMFSNAIREDPRCDIGYCLRAVARMRQRKYRGALRDLDTALKMRPKEPSYQYNRALCRCSMGDFLGAMGDLQLLLAKHDRLWMKLRTRVSFDADELDGDERKRTAAPNETEPARASTARHASFGKTRAESPSGRLGSTDSLEPMAVIPSKIQRMLPRLGDPDALRLRALLLRRQGDFHGAFADYSAALHVERCVGGAEQVAASRVPNLCRTESVEQGYWKRYKEQESRLRETGQRASTSSLPPRETSFKAGVDGRETAMLDQEMESSAISWAAEEQGTVDWFTGGGSVSSLLQRARTAGSSHKTQSGFQGFNSDLRASQSVPALHKPPEEGALGQSRSHSRASLPALPECVQVSSAAAQLGDLSWTRSQGARLFHCLPPPLVEPDAVIKGKTDLYTAIFSRPSEAQQALQKPPAERSEEDLQSNLTLLREIPLMLSLSDEQTRAIAQCVRLRRLADGATLCVEGQPVTGLGIVVTGCLTVRVTVYNEEGVPSEIRVDSLAAGDTIGELSLLFGPERTLSVTARGEAEVAEIPVDDFYVLRLEEALLSQFEHRSAILRESGAFASWSEEDLLKLACVARPQRFHQGTVLVEQGAPPGDFYILTKGICRVYKRSKELEGLNRSIQDVAEKINALNYAYSYHHSMKAGAKLRIAPDIRALLDAPPEPAPDEDAGHDHPAVNENSSDEGSTGRRGRFSSAGKRFAIRRDTSIRPTEVQRRRLELKTRLEQLLRRKAELLLHEGKNRTAQQAEEQKEEEKRRRLESRIQQRMQLRSGVRGGAGSRRGGMGGAASASSRGGGSEDLNSVDLARTGAGKGSIASRSRAGNSGSDAGVDFSARSNRRDTQLGKGEAAVAAEETDMDDARVNVGTLFPPSIFGEMAILQPEDGRAEARIEAGTFIEVLTLPKSKIPGDAFTKEKLQHVEKQAPAYPPDVAVRRKHRQDTRWRRVREEMLMRIDKTRWPVARERLHRTPGGKHLILPVPSWKKGAQQ